MNVESISAFSGIEQVGIKQQAPLANTFGDFLYQGVEKVDTDLQLAKLLSTEYAQGEAVPVEQLMIALEQAQQSLQLAVEVKNKLIAAYQELFRMQI